MNNIVNYLKDVLITSAFITAMIASASVVVIIALNLLYG